MRMFIFGFGVRCEASPRKKMISQIMIGHWMEWFQVYGGREHYFGFSSQSCSRESRTFGRMNYKDRENEFCVMTTAKQMWSSEGQGSRVLLPPSNLLSLTTAAEKKQMFTLALKSSSIDAAIRIKRRLRIEYGDVHIVCILLRRYLTMERNAFRALHAHILNLNLMVSLLAETLFELESLLPEKRRR